MCRSRCGRWCSGRWAVHSRSSRRAPLDFNHVGCMWCHASSRDGLSFSRNPTMSIHCPKMSGSCIASCWFSEACALAVHATTGMPHALKVAMARSHDPRLLRAGERADCSQHTRSGGQCRWDGCSAWRGSYAGLRRMARGCRNRHTQADAKSLGIARIVELGGHAEAGRAAYGVGTDRLVLTRQRNEPAYGEMTRRKGTAICHVSSWVEAQPGQLGKRERQMQGVGQAAWQPVCYMRRDLVMNR